MKAKIILFCLSLLVTCSFKAQTYVTIPDANFVTWLQTNVPACMNGNQMNIDCAEIQNRTIINITSGGISNLSGLEYFINLENLRCVASGLTSLPNLPSSLLTLNCNGNQLTSLPSLPNNVTQIECMDNLLTQLPTLPVSLRRLYAAYNQIQSISNFPDSLKTLVLANNLITSIPDFPSSLEELYMQNNQISCFPEFPNSLIDSNTFSIMNNPFTCLPNYVPAMDSITLTYPLCMENDLINNPHACNSVLEISDLVTPNTNNKFMNIFPNPFSSSTTVIFKNSLKNADLTLYTIFGQKVRTISDFSGDKLKINRENLASGVYYLSLESEDNRVETVKMVIGE